MSLLAASGARARTGQFYLNRRSGQPQTASYGARRLAARVVAVVDGPQASLEHVRVNLRRGQVGVPQHHLDGAQVGAAIEEVGGEGMADDVRAERVPHADRRAVPFQQLPEA